MTWTGYSPLARRGMLILLAGALALVGVAGFPYFWNAQIRQEVAAQKAELALVAARAGRASERSPRLTDADQPERMFLPGNTAGTRLAAFQSIVSGVALRSGLQVLRMQPLAADEAESLSPYRLEADASGSLEQLRSFLVEIESILPVVMVIGAEIRPRSAEDSTAQPYPSDDLAISLTLEAFAWRETP